jgi:hypothetical protein
MGSFGIFTFFCAGACTVRSEDSLLSTASAINHFHVAHPCEVIVLTRMKQVFDAS